MNFSRYWSNGQICLILAAGAASLALAGIQLVYAQSAGGRGPVAFSPEGAVPQPDCKGVVGGRAKDLGCGCDNPGPGLCGCDPGIKDLGCGCGRRAPGSCGCDPCPPTPSPTRTATPIPTPTPNPYCSAVRFNCYDILHAAGYYYGRVDQYCVNNPYARYSSVLWDWNRDPRYLPNAGNYCMVCMCVRRPRWGCFAPGTLITLSDGRTRAVEDLAVGDSVWNPATKTAARVERVIEGEEKLPLIEYGYGERLSRVSQKHPVVTGAGLKRASELSLTDTVIGSDGALHPLTAVRELTLEDGQIVINLLINSDSEAEEDHLLLADGLVTGDWNLQLKLNEDPQE